MCVIAILSFGDFVLVLVEKACRPITGTALVAFLPQVEAHPYFRNDALLHWCKEHGIHVTAYSPLGAPDSVAATGALPGPPLLEEPLVKDVARRLGKSPAQVWGPCLAFGVQRPSLPMRLRWGTYPRHGLRSDKLLAQPPASEQPWGAVACKSLSSLSLGGGAQGQLL